MNKEFIEKQQNEQYELLHKELPNLIHKILIIRLMPEMFSEDLLEKDIEQIKKITNAECKSTLEYLELIRQSELF